MWALASSSAHFREKELHIGVPWILGGVILALFEPLYKRAFAAGFSVIVVALTLAYSSQSIMFARVTGGLHAADVCVSCANRHDAAHCCADLPNKHTSADQTGAALSRVHS